MARNIMLVVGLAILTLAFSFPFIMATVTYTPTATGDFYINDILATEETVMEVLDPNLSIKFILTSGDENNIDYVWIRVYGPDPVYGGTKHLGDFTLSHTSTNTWTLTYTLPHAGTFEIHGLILGSGTGNKDLRLMSVVGTWTGEEGIFTGQPLERETQTAIFQITLGIVGAGLMVYGLLSKKRRWTR